MPIFLEHATSDTKIALSLIHLPVAAVLIPALRGGQMFVWGRQNQRSVGIDKGTRSARAFGQPERDPRDLLVQRF